MGEAVEPAALRGHATGAERGSIQTLAKATNLKMVPNRLTVMAVVTALATFVVVFLAETVISFLPGRRLGIAVFFSSVTLFATFVATRIFWNATARAAAFVIAASATCFSGILTLAKVDSPVGSLVGWSAVVASAACAVLFTRVRGSVRSR